MSFRLKHIRNAAPDEKAKHDDKHPVKPETTLYQIIKNQEESPRNITILKDNLNPGITKRLEWT